MSRQYGNDCSNSCEAFAQLRLRKTFQSADRPRCTEVADELRRAEGKLYTYGDPADGHIIYRFRPA